MAADAPYLDEEDLEDLDDAPDVEVEEIEEQVLDQATAARTIDELEAEIKTLKRLEKDVYKRQLRKCQMKKRLKLPKRYSTHLRNTELSWIEQKNHGTN